MIEITLRYDGALAAQNAIDFYDAARALAGFERSLALVTHLALHGEVITQATALRDAQILIHAPEEGSWKVVAAIVGAAFAVGSVGKDSPVGHVVTSIYDYVLYETMGFHADYDKTLQQLHAEKLAAKGITKQKINSAMEKTETSIADMHRPIVASKTATSAALFDHSPSGAPRKLGPDMSVLTYEYLMQSIRSEEEDGIVGVVSSYNMNTFKGRLFVIEEQRPIPFELDERARTSAIIGLITRSLQMNAAQQNDPRAVVVVYGFRIESRSGRLKMVRVNRVIDNSDDFAALME
ncbi:hypothetical protein [Sphingosinicella sp. BN140058]|uniref:DUF7946 domain-containing protein n=1 Tax=Sphingosinicella sp. BN140058 TaxID=1892855 RepID=UPI0010110C24|nr:hypothetical protein [Sphingosinicella sp. BN140058]QAY75147.1 hypothetical protein ETR14_00330 [Sphingosinicella sp. BN140058]